MAEVLDSLLLAVEQQLRSPQTPYVKACYERLQSLGMDEAQIREEIADCLGQERSRKSAHFQKRNTAPFSMPSLGKKSPFPKTISIPCNQNPPVAEVSRLPAPQKIHATRGGGVPPPSPSKKTPVQVQNIGNTIDSIHG
ncbi:MAG: hypothetical protein EAZ81_04630 [Verrucomicrobia bacterium]|nr:MAG: hypothetical protein EAZ81_04630 [Verrucomicrobiota bacterium]